MTILIAAALLGVLLLVLALWWTADSVLARRHGRMLLLGGACLFPLGVSALALRSGVERSSHTSFCMSCHEMLPYGHSLMVDNPRVLPALHYQQRLITRESTCFACHTDYAMFGDMKAKLNGARHVWVHYLGDVPERPALYKPYPNYNCLHCHDDARGYLEEPAHAQLFLALRNNERSCLSCHNVGHALDDVKTKNFWQAEAR